MPMPLEPELLVFVVQGDDHERKAFTARDELEALNQAAAAWHEQYFDPDEGDLAQYGPDDFDVVAVYREGTEVPVPEQLPAGGLSIWPTGEPERVDEIDPADFDRREGTDAMRGLLFGLLLASVFWGIVFAVTIWINID